MDCLIVSYSEPSRNRERRQFFHEDTKKGLGWGRFTHLNYINYEDDIMLPNHMASIAKVIAGDGKIQKNETGHFNWSDITGYSVWKVPLLGGLYLYQYLKGLSFDIKIVQHAQIEQEQFDAYLSQGPKVIAISTTLLLNSLDIAELVAYCRERSPESFIVLGGMSIWNNYLANKDNPDVFKAYQADAIVVDNRAFKTLGQIIDHIKNGKSVSDIPNLIMYKNGKTEVTTKKKEDFDFRKDAINWDLIEDGVMRPILSIRTQISCPFTCSFCSYPTSQGEVLKAELDVFEEELKTLQKRGVTHLLFVDDTFNVPIQRFKKVLNILKKYNFRWYSFIRCQYLDKEQVISMRESGCDGAYLGIESANNDILKAMNKRATVGEYRRGVALLASQGITTCGSFIIGFPGDNEKTFKDAIDFIETSGIDFYNAKIFFYDHTTPVAQQNKEFELTGQGMYWTHKTMNSSLAFERTEEIIQTIKNVPYIPQHSGEIWEIAYFYQQGFTREKLRTLYRNFNMMLQDELSNSSDRLKNQSQLFNEIVGLCERGKMYECHGQT